jgi:hypothetical protein
MDVILDRRPFWDESASAAIAKFTKRSHDLWFLDFSSDGVRRQISYSTGHISRRLSWRIICASFAIPA